MTVDEKLISRLEKLAKLDLTAAEKEKLRKELDDILKMVDKLEELDTEGIDPLVYVLQEDNVWRKDQVQGQIDRKAAFKNAPDADGEYFKVPKVIDIKK
jgi:aspartyl-tRNA(Asn)/glutamyl-tRNA(Gln) amidotransferase subunit C